jgi:hypothetical protein
MMHTRLALAAALAVAVCAPIIAHADAKEDVVAAVKKVAGDSYSWKSVSEGGFGGSQEGKKQKDGLAWIAIRFRDNTIEVIKQGEQGAIKTEDGWKSLAEVADSDAQGAPRFIARIVQNSKGAAAEALDVAENVAKVEKSDDAYTATLSEEQVKKILTSFRRGADQAPQVGNAKGDVKFWVKDGVVSKVQYHLAGTMTFNNQERDVGRTTTVEFKDVGHTNVEVPAEAKEKLK